MEARGRSRSPVARRNWAVASLERVSIRTPFVALRQSACLIPDLRKRDMLVAMLTCVEMYLLNRNAPEMWGQEVFEQVTKLGGFVKKVAQQVSQLPDVVPNAVVRGRLQQLEDKNIARAIPELEAQLRTAFPESDPCVIAVLGVGCMGEVSQVTMMYNGQTRTMVAKTINPMLSVEFARDRDVFRTIPSNIAPLIKAMRMFDPRGADEVDAIVSKVADIAENDGMYQSMMDGLDMQSERRLTEEASGHLESLPGARIFSVPKIFAATQDVLLMELVEGQTLAKGAQVNAESFVKEFVNLYVDMMFGRGFFHQDPHPGNVLIKSDGSIALLDWGEVVRIPSEIALDDVESLLKSVVCGTGDSLRQLFERLGVQVKSGKPCNDENYLALANNFNIPQVLEADPDVATDTIIKAQSFRCPAWLEAWQKATYALAILFQKAGATPGMVETELKRKLKIA